MKTSIAAWWVLPVASLLIACAGPPPPRTPPLPSSLPIAQDDGTNVPVGQICGTPNLGVAAYRIAVYDPEAYDAFRKAMGMSGGPERDAQWRKAAALYKAALEKKPDDGFAPEYVMNGAYCYKQVGEYDHAVALYTTFIEAYGAEAILSRLEKGDPTAKPPVPANPSAYQERIRFLTQAHEQLTTASVVFFDYAVAAGRFLTVARNVRFKKEDRRTAARNAVVLYAHIGDRDGMASARAMFLTLDPPAEAKLEIDYFATLTELAQWDEQGPDEGANHAARLKVIAAMDAYSRANQGNKAAAAWVVESAFHAAKARRAGNEPGADAACKTAITAFERFRDTAPVLDDKSTALGSAQAEMAAECAYEAIDRKIQADFDPRSKRTFAADLEKAKGYVADLQTVIARFGSHRWSAAARARQGSLYDASRSRLHGARPPQLDDTDRSMIKLYVEATLQARAWKVYSPAVEHATRRLAFYTDRLGEAKMRELCWGIDDPGTKLPFEYREGLFLRRRAGMTLQLAADGAPVALPMVP